MTKKVKHGTKTKNTEPEKETDIKTEKKTGPSTLKKSLKLALKSKDFLKIDKAADDILSYLEALSEEFANVDSSEDEKESEAKHENKDGNGKLDEKMKIETLASKLSEFFDIIETCIDANHPKSIKILYQLINMFPSEDDMEKKSGELVKVIFDKIVEANPPRSSEEISKQLYDNYEELIDVMEYKWCSEKGKSESIYKFEKALVQHQSIHLARLASYIDSWWYNSHANISRARNIQLFNDISELVKVQKSRSDPDSKEFRDYCKNYCGSLIANLLQSTDRYSAQEKEETYGTLRSLIENTKSMIRPGWCEPSKENTESKNSDDSNDSDSEDEEAKKNVDSENTSVKMKNHNLNFFEFCLSKALNHIWFGGEDMAVQVIQHNFDWLLQRVELARQYIQCGQADKLEDCECSCDSITRTGYNCLLNFVDEHPKYASEYNERLVNVFMIHMNVQALHTLTKLYPYNSSEIESNFDKLFKFGMTAGPDTLCKFVMTAARYECMAIDKFHVDELEDRLLSEKASTDEVSALVQVLDAISENRSELMHGRGNDYYQAIVRNTTDQEAIWMITDNILKCIGLLDEGEARRVMDAFVKGCEQIPAKSHVASVLENMQTLGMVHRSIVREYSGWIDEKMKDPYLKKHAVKLVIILKGDPVAGAKESSTCSLS